MGTATVGIADDTYFVIGGPLDGRDWAVATIRAAQGHGFRYVAATDEGERVYVFMGYRPIRAASAPSPKLASRQPHVASQPGAA